MRQPLVILCILIGGAAAYAQGKEGPKVLVPMPLGVAPGATTRLTLRGLRLDIATEVRCQAPKARAKLLS
jgi:hypothetical protein